MNAHVRDNLLALAPAAYSEFTASVSTTATTEATATTIVSTASVTYTGAQVEVTFFCQRVQVPNGSFGVISLWQDTTSLGQIAVCESVGATSGAPSWPVLATRRVSPSAAAHTFTAKVHTSTGTTTVYAGAGGAGTAVPGYLKVVYVP